MAAAGECVEARIWAAIILRAPRRPGLSELTRRFGDVFFLAFATLAMKHPQPSSDKGRQKTFQHEPLAQAQAMLGSFPVEYSLQALPFYLLCRFGRGFFQFFYHHSENRRG
jgi:hypothetical protein